MSLQIINFEARSCRCFKCPMKPAKETHTPMRKWNKLCIGGGGTNPEVGAFHGEIQIDKKIIFSREQNSR